MVEEFLADMSTVKGALDSFPPGANSCQFSGIVLVVCSQNDALLFARGLE